MSYSIYTVARDVFPESLREIPEPPQTLFVAGNMPDANNKLLCVVGSRNYSPYGKEVCKHIIEGLAGYPITIVSGLALGIDGIAHTSALEAGLQTIAIPGSGLDPSVLYPRSHYNLAEDIIGKGGGLLSEFKPTFKATPWSFPQRNRLMAGLSDAILVIEAEEKSGTLITSRLATEYNKDVYTVPGSIFSPQSAGPHMLLRLGATPIRNAADIIDAFGFSNIPQTDTLPYPLSEAEQTVYEHIAKAPISRNDLIRQLSFETHVLTALLTSLEIAGIIEEKMGYFRTTR